MKLKVFWFFSLVLAMVPVSRGEGASTGADSIYLGGTILTMNGARPRAGAVAVGNGEILAVGAKEEVLQYRGSATNLVDLAGRTLLPGFIDSHSHVSLVAIKSATAEMSPPPTGSTAWMPWPPAFAHISRKPAPVQTTG